MDEILVPVFSSLVLLGYHALLAFAVVKYPHRTVIGLTRLSRRIWVRCVVHKRDSILAVQSFRNWLVGFYPRIMASSLLASTTIALIVALVAVLSAVGSRLSTELFGDFQVYKAVIIIALFMASFFCFTQAIRIYNHTAFLITIGAFRHDLDVISPDTTSQQGDRNQMLMKKITSDIEFAAGLLNNGALYQTIGLRFFYLTFPVVFWVFSEWYFLGSSIFLVLILAYLDLAIAQYKERKEIDPSYSE